MVDQLSAFADEVTRVSREVGTEGRLGGQAYVRGVSGVWQDLTDNVNFMANNLTGQVRNIAQVATAVANGDLTKKIDVNARGEILELKTTHQHHGRPAVRVRLGGHPGGPRGRQRGPARRPGRGTRRVGHLEAPDRERQRAGQQPDHAGARDRRRGQRGRRGRPDPVGRGRGARRGRRAQGQRQPDGRQPALDHPGQPGAGLAEDQPRQDRGPDAGPPRPAGAGPPDPRRADPAHVRPVRCDLPRQRRGDAAWPAPGFRVHPHRHVRLHEGRAHPVRGGRGPGRPGGHRAHADRDQRRARRLPQGRVGTRPGSAGERGGAADPVRGPGARRARDRVADPVQRRPPRVLRPVRRDHRRGDQHDHGQLPDRGAAQRVAAAHHAASGALRRAAAPAGRAAQVQRGARGEGRAARQAEQRDRGAEPPDRAGTADPGGTRPAAGDLLAGTSPTSSRTCHTSCARR